MSQILSEEDERRLKYAKLDMEISKLLGPDDYQFYLNNVHREALEWKDGHIKRQEGEILSRDITIKALQKENDLIWKTFIERLAEEKLKNRSIGPVTLVPSNIK